MSRARPTPEEERWLAILRRARHWKRSGWISEETLKRIRERIASSWRPGSLFSRVAFFVLTALALQAFYGILALGQLPAKGWIAAAAACGLAELLIIKKRFIHTGIEEALYLGGLFCIIFGFPGPPRVEGLLLLAAASVIAGWRVLNPWFVVLAMLLIMFYVQGKFDGQTAAIASGIVGAAALGLMPLRLRRPFHTTVLNGTAVISPVLVWIFLGMGLEPLLPLLAALLVIAIIVTLRFRLHAALFSALVSGGLMAFEVSENIEWSPESKLMIAGGLMFAMAFLLERWLRETRYGFTSQKLLDRDNTLVDLISVPIAAQSVLPATTPEAQIERGQGEGGFGGAGASGKY